MLARSERTCLTRVADPAGRAPTAGTASLFEYELETRYECSVTKQVRYVGGRQALGNTVELAIPLDLAVNREQVEMLQVLPTGLGGLGRGWVGRGGFTFEMSLTWALNYKVIF